MTALILALLLLIVFTLLSGLLALLREPAGSHRLARRLMWRVGLSALLLLLLFAGAGLGWWTPHRAF